MRQKFKWEFEQWQSNVRIEPIWQFYPSPISVTSLRWFSCSANHTQMFISLLTLLSLVMGANIQFSVFRFLSLSDFLNFSFSLCFDSIVSLVLRRQHESNNLKFVFYPFCHHKQIMFENERVHVTNRSPKWFLIISLLRSERKNYTQYTSERITFALRA